MNDYARTISIKDLNLSKSVIEALNKRGIKNLENLLDSVFSTLRISYLADDDEFNEVLKILNSINYTINNKGNFVIDDASKLELKKK